jgi:ribosomal protein L11 methyltransferase
MASVGPEASPADDARTLLRLRVTVADADEGRVVADLLSADDGVAVAALATAFFEIEPGGGWIVDGYFDSRTTEATDLLMRLASGLPAGAGVALESVPEENWVAISQAALPPVEAGRFLVHGAHDRLQVGRRRHAIEIEAGEAFGTAHHATTQGCLEALDRLGRKRPPRRVLDLGCGSGVLAIAASRLWPRSTVAASDIDPIAVEVTRSNARLNRAGPRIRAIAAAGLDHAALRSLGPVDLVVANILAGPLIVLAPRLARAIPKGGRVVLSGLLGEQAREVTGAYRMAGFRLERRQIRHNWATLVLVRG